jgi:hypothetical protein
MRSLVLLLCVTACGTDRANVAGDYAISITNRDNGCNFGNWTAGASSAAAVTLTQTGGDVTASVTGLGAVVLEAVIGGHVYTGKVGGTELHLSLVGTRSNTMGGCTYTFNSQIDATVDGDVLDGQIFYLAATNGNADCGALTSCRSFQDFNGTRPPS